MPKDNNKNKHYTKEFKDSILEKMESSNESVQKIADEFEIFKSTIYQWVRTKAKKKQTSYNK